MAMVEPLHGLTFALAHLTCVTVIGRIMPPPWRPRRKPSTPPWPWASPAPSPRWPRDHYDWLCAQAFWAMALLCALALPLTLRLRLIAP